MAMRPIRGRDFILSIVKGATPTPVCYSTDFTLEADRETLEKTPLTGNDRDWLVTFKEYKLGISTVASYYDGFSLLDIYEAYQNGTRLSWFGRDSTAGGVVHSGVCIINNVSFASPVRGDFASEANAIGCLRWNMEKLPFFTTAYLADENKVRLTGCPNPYPVSVYWYENNGNNRGVLIGVALNAGGVVTLFNTYPGNIYFQLSIGIDGCSFNLRSEWNTPWIPSVVFAQPTPDMVLSPDQENNTALSPDQENDHVLSPYYA